jgi:CTP:molybdopterin cytidylyltransferase MocA
VLDLEVDEPGVLIDVDTPDDYLRIFGRSFDAPVT